MGVPSRGAATTRPSAYTELVGNAEKSFLVIIGVKHSTVRLLKRRADMCAVRDLDMHSISMVSVLTVDRWSLKFR